MDYEKFNDKIYKARSEDGYFMTYIIPDGTDEDDERDGGLCN